MSTKSREVVFGIRFLWCLTRALSAKPNRHSNGYDPHPNSRMENDGISDYSGSNRRRDNLTDAQIIQFRDYQNPRDLAPMHGDIETSLVKLNHMAAEVFNAL